MAGYGFKFFSPPIASNGPQMITPSVSTTMGWRNPNSLIDAATASTAASFCRGFPWVVDRDTLESIFNVLSFDQLVSFLRWRTKLHGVAINEDEAVFAGFFLQHGPVEMPKNADLVRLEANYADVFEAEYLRRKGIPVDMPTETGPPVWISTRREGDTIVIEKDGRLQDIFALTTGDWTGGVDERQGSEMLREEAIVQERNDDKCARLRRNGPCPCGSGRKYKKCCLRRE